VGYRDRDGRMQAFVDRRDALRPAHSRCHQFVARFTRRLQPYRYLHSCSGCFRLEHFAGWDLHPLESAALHGAHPLLPVAPWESNGMDPSSPNRHRGARLEVVSTSQQ
jgi:hypothetical protein